MKETEYLKIQKPENGEFYNIAISNANADLIDKGYGELKTSIAEAKEELNNIELTAEKVTVADANNNFTSPVVEGVLQELATKDKELTNKDKALDTKIDTTKSALETAIANNKTEIDGEIANLKQSVSSGKQLIATAVTGKDVPTNGSDSFQKMADNIDSIKTKLPILEGDAGVTEDSEGKIYGVIDWENRTIYSTETLTTREWVNTDIVNGIKVLYFSNFIYVSEARVMRKLTLEGVQVWEYTHDSNINSFGVDQAYNVYFSDYTNYVRKITDNLDLEWSYLIDNSRNCPVDGFVTSTDGYSYILYNYGQYKNWITRISPDGQGLWTKSLGTTYLIGKAIDLKDGYIYTCINNGGVIKHDIETGSQTEIVSLYGSHESISVGNSGLVYMGSRDFDRNLGMVLKVDESNPSGIVSSRITVSGKKLTFNYIRVNDYNEVYVGYEDSLIKFSSKGELLWIDIDFTSIVKSISLDHKGNIYCISDSVKKIKDNYDIQKVAVLKEREVQ